MCWLDQASFHSVENTTCYSHSDSGSEGTIPTAFSFSVVDDYSWDNSDSPPKLLKYGAASFVSSMPDETKKDSLPPFSHAFQETITKSKSQLGLAHTVLSFMCSVTASSSKRTMEIRKEVVTCFLEALNNFSKEECNLILESYEGKDPIFR